MKLGAFILLVLAYFLVGAIWAAIHESYLRHQSSRDCDMYGKVETYYALDITLWPMCLIFGLGFLIFGVISYITDKVFDAIYYRKNN